MRGRIVGAVATSDAVWSMAQLIKINTVLKVSAPSKGGPEPNRLGQLGEKATNSDDPGNREHYI